MANKIPAFQFYPSDWRSDNGVQSLNYYERGVWFEILCLMHESEQRGKLLLNGKAMPDEALARLLGLDKQVLLKTLTTLLDFGVCSRDETGILFNRRMVKDETERQANAKRQRDFYQKTHVEKPNGEPNAQPNGNLTAIQQKPNKPSSSSASSSKKRKEEEAESQDEYLIRKQLEYPKIDVQKLFRKFTKDCLDKDKPPKRRNFEIWLENEDEPMELPPEIVEKKETMTDEQKRKAFENQRKPQVTI